MLSTSSGTAEALHAAAIARMSNVPPEIDSRAAVAERRRAALDYLRNADRYYERSLVAATTVGSESVERWRVAGKRGLAAVRDLLRAIE